ncbi:MAG: MFS transporter [Chloroflexi bacterium]|nr:MFS transporter [Chloroflexota bacterium]
MRSLTRVQVGGLAMIMSGSLIGGLDQNLIATALPTIIGELGGLDRYALVFSSYLFVATAVTPIGGRLADIFGRKPVYFVGLSAFLAGALMGGLAPSMDWIVASRALAGLGGGILIPVGLTILGDLFEIRMRATVQPLLSSVWVLAALVGPAAGGLLTQAASWRWTFFVNVPLAVVALALLIPLYREPVKPRGGAVDWPGAASFATATAALLLALSGVALWVTVPLALGAGAVFLVAGRRAADPFVSLALLRRPAIGAAVALHAVIGAMTVGYVTYLPPFVQGVLGRAPVEAGLVVSSSSIGWTSGTILTAALILRWGPRRPALAGTLCWSFGAALLTLLGADAPLLLPAAGAVLLGLGMGLSINPLLLAAQTAASVSERGAAMSQVQFGRNLGAAAGVAALGAVLAASMGPLAAQGALLLTPGTRGELAPEVLATLRAALHGGLHTIFVAMTVLAVAGAFFARRLPVRLEEGAGAGSAALGLS